MISAFQRHRLAALLAAVALALGGCSMRSLSPAGTPVGEQAPVGLRSLEMASTEGHHAVLLRLSRIPTMVRHSSSTEPAQITIQAWGPPGVGDLAERALPQDDPYVSQVRVSREGGALKIVLDLRSATPPPHMVHEMADWIMVRFSGPQS